jgi:uncharacterized protein YkwD
MFDSRVAVAARLHRTLMTTSLRVVFLLIISLVTCTSVAFAQKAARTSTSQPVARLIMSGPLPPDADNSREHSTVSNRSSSASTTTTYVVSQSVASLERRAFELINAQRTARGQKALPWDAQLARLARQHSENMARTDFFNHNAPGGMTMVNRAHAQGLRGWKALGENIAYNQGYDDPAGFVTERWMISYKHRENLLNARWTRSAVGVAIASDGRVFFTQVFIAP